MPYFFSDDAADVQPSFYFAPRAASPPFDVTIDLPEIFRQPPGASLDVGTLRLAPSSSGVQITIPAAGAAWTFGGDPLRAAVRRDFVDFLAELEGRGLVPGALAMVRQAVAQRMPSTFDETLFFRYGLDGAAGQVDLLPGMRLRLDFQGYQFVSPAEPETLFNGYTGSGSATWELVAHPDAEGFPSVRLDAFQARIAKTVVDPNEGGGGGAIDVRTGWTRRHLRLLYPARVASSDSQGFLGLEKNVTLLGADTLAALESATRGYLETGQVEGDAVATYFRGRTAATPEIRFVFQGETRWTALGTTLRHAISTLSDLFAPEQQLAGPRARLTALRQVFDTAAREFPHLETLDLDANGRRPFNGGRDTFDLPLVKGDVLSLDLEVPGAQGSGAGGQVGGGQGGGGQGGSTQGGGAVQGGGKGQGSGKGK